MNHLTTEERAEPRRLCEAAGSVPYIAVSREAMRRLLAMVEEMEGVVVRLPTTADGVPIVPGMTVWAWFADSHDDGPEQVSIEHVRGGGVYVWCYSTEEAAKAAQPHDQPGGEA